MPAGDKKYLLVAKRRLTFTSSSVGVPVSRSSIIDERWYNVPRRPLTGFTPLPVLVSLLLTVVAPIDTTFAAADILKKFIGKDTVMTRFCLPMLAVSVFLQFNFIQNYIYNPLASDGPTQAIHFDLQ
jgi:hypothetical protein